MTCIIGLEDNGNVYVGSDSALSDSWTISSLQAKEKIFVNSDIIFGCCGSMRVAQLLHYALEIPEHDSDKSDMEYLVVDFVDALRSLLKDKGTLHSSDEDGKVEYLPHSALIVGYKSKVYVVDADFQVSRSIGGFVCEGSGKEVASGAMQVIKDRHDLTPEDKIKKSLEASAIHTCYVQGPFHVLAINDEGEELED